MLDGIQMQVYSVSWRHHTNPEERHKLISLIKIALKENHDNTHISYASPKDNGFIPCGM